MAALLALGAILGAMLVGIISPGPSFVFVSRIAVTASRRSGIAAALGMGLGGMVFSGFAVLGLIAVLTKVKWLWLAFRVVGGLYLLWIGVTIWRGAGAPISADKTAPVRPLSPGRALMLGFLTQISNPKTAVVYAGVFAAFLPAAPATWLLLCLPPACSSIEVAWYSVVALVFSSAGPRAAYLRGKCWVDRLAGGVMGALGARLASEAVLAG